MAYSVGDARNKPLFAEPTPDIERSDEWSYPKGFLLGTASGMGGAKTALDVAQDFMEAAYALSEAINDNQWQDYGIGYPVLYLYRHSLELFLKGALGGGWGHNLVDLARQFEEKVRRERGREVAGWVLRRIREFAAIDPNSHAFRYAGVVDADKVRHRPIPGDWYVSVPHLQNVMIELNLELAHYADDLQTERIKSLAFQHRQRRGME